MNYAKTLLLIIFCLMPLSAKSNEPATTITPAQLRKLCNTDPLDHCVYLGTSDGYHYFQHTHDKTAQRYKVKESTLKLNAVFPLSEGKPYIVMTEMIDKGTTKTQ